MTFNDNVVVMIYFNLFVFSWKDEDPDWQVMLIWPVKDPQHAEQKLIKNQVYANGSVLNAIC